MNCLFTLLIVSFEVQKFLILMNYCFFSFGIIAKKALHYLWLCRFTAIFYCNRFISTSLTLWSFIYFIFFGMVKDKLQLHSFKCGFLIDSHHFFLELYSHIGQEINIIFSLFNFVNVLCKCFIIFTEFIVS